MDENDDPRLYSPKVAAGMLQISLKLLYEHIHRGKLIAFDVSLPGAKRRTLRISKVEIERWLREDASRRAA